MSVESSGGRAQGRRDRQGPGAPARPTRDAAAAELTRLLTPAVAAAGFDLEEVDVRPAGRRRLVRIVVDGDGGVGLDDIARLSETASGLLDESDVMGTSAYVLEVTSPGVDRPLTEPRHWRRAVGRLVVAPLTEGGQVEGRVVAADDEAVEIDVVRKRRGKGAGAKGGGRSAGPEPASGGQASGKGRAAAPEIVRRRFGLGELGRGRVQVEFRPAADKAEETRSPAEPD
ncbi:ribosome maturation factor RimP [Actinomadura madurae]|uniref:Ribosome maturation factor RimP n=1 Tax=Actinomadura madurae TaxID=1993 RepID=A0A1I4WD69_9ACTN|nr:ribosome maturation factor RimP [Actinomadura madurae]SFN11190.1 ribosome maturation factor RimP [Actinomadura madurae]SPT64494.1 Ribosome maturation factor RimP [Actinomadura madurae]